MTGRVLSWPGKKWSIFDNEGFGFQTAHTTWKSEMSKVSKH
jgi:hypothetical protein